MPTIPNQQSANDSVIVRVPVPQPVQNTQRKPRQPQQNQQSTFKKTTSNTPQSIILPYFPAVGNEDKKTAGNATINNNAATQYSYSLANHITTDDVKHIKFDAPKINYNKSIRRKLKNILRWKKITLSNPGLCTYSREDDEFFKAKHKNIEDKLPHLVHADQLEEQGLEHLAKHIRDSVENGKIEHHNEGKLNPEWDKYHMEWLKFNPYDVAQTYPVDNKNKIKVVHNYLSPKNEHHRIIYQNILSEEEEANENHDNIYNEIEKYKSLLTPPEKYARKIDYNKEKAPTGGIINRGMYFPGGSFIPDMPSGLPNYNSSLPTSSTEQPQVSKKKKLLTDIKDILKSHKSQLPINDKVLYEKYRGPSYVPRKDEQWYDEDWHTVTSSNVQSVAYNPTFKRLYVEFKRKKGGHSVYQYENVPDDIHDALMQASSKGKFVYYVLRNHGTDSDYSYRQID